MRLDQSTLDMLNAGEKQKPKKHKYNAKSVVVDGIQFPSIKEGERYSELSFQQHCGLISDLKLQVPYTLQDAFTYKGKRIAKITYLADFEYEKNGIIYTEDTKGVKTSVYKLKKKMLLKRYPDINFIET